ncbi:hypothetical protein ACFWFX_15395 [Streptomyces roseolus]|uniref:hypothetical protein n=1 Tax=Streptomyces roseolus TaxID=67358 RepID=UPI00365242E0
MDEEWAPLRARWAVDRDGRIGRVEEQLHGRSLLLPPGGGRKWEVATEELRRPTDEEAAKIRILTTPVEGVK